MASAGRILIMPKGAYKEDETYEMLDLVSNGGTSWLAKKTAKGIEPNEDNSEYWHKMFDVPEAVNEAAGAIFDEKIKEVAASDIGAVAETCSSYEGVSDTDEINLNAWLDSVVENMPDDGVCHVRFLCNAINELPYFGTIYKQDNEYATIIATAYNTGREGALHKIKFDGVWESAKFIAHA